MNDPSKLGSAYFGELSTDKGGSAPGDQSLREGQVTS